MVEAAGVESGCKFRPHSHHGINIGEISRFNFLFTNINESKRDFPVRNCQEFYTLTNLTIPLLALICEPYFASITCATCESTERLSVLS